MKRLLVLGLVLGLTLSFGSAGFATDDGRSQVSALSTVAPTGHQGTRAPGSLTTIFAQNNRFAGNTFDIIPTRNIQITGLDVNTDPVGATATVTVYYKTGTAVGFENNAGAWTMLASGTGTSAGVDNPTFIDLPGAGGINFTAGDTYGIYVDYNHPTVRCLYTDGGPNTYSNSDLSLVTNTGQISPAFSGSFYPRKWNGTIYYDDGGPDSPRVDIKCNGGDAGVSMYAGTNAKLDYMFHAGSGMGVGVDLWLAVKHPFGFFSYDGIGPYMGWNYGLGSAFYTGPLADMSGTCLDHALGINSYKAYIGIDTAANGVLNMANIYTMDMVDFDVVTAPTIYMWDDGSTENLMCWTSGGDMCWLQCWNAYAGGTTILDVQCIFGSVMYSGYAPGNGSPCDVHVWDDPTDDGDPSDCVLVSSEAITVQQVDTDLYNVHPLTSPAVIAGEFYVGCNMPHAAMQYCMPIDTTTTYVSGVSWYCGTNTPPFDPNNLMNNQFTPTEYTNFTCIRAGY